MFIYLKHFTVTIHTTYIEKIGSFASTFLNVRSRHCFMIIQRSTGSKEINFIKYNPTTGSRQNAIGNSDYDFESATLISSLEPLAAVYNDVITLPASQLENSNLDLPLLEQPENSTLNMFVTF